MTTSATRKATNAVWRGDGPGRVAATVSSPATAAPPSSDAPAARDEVYLDTPRAFARNLNMVAAAVRGVTEADKYLDSNSFSWNLDSTKKGRETSNGAASSPSTPSPKQQRQEQQQQYLDKPRPFKSNIDMVSSNFSGAKFKRSSDTPPELKNVRDYYDITSAPLSKSDGTSRGRGGSGGSGGMEDAFDITRAPFSTLDRTSSVVRDTNIAALRVRPNGKQSRVDDEGPGDTDNLSPSSAMEEEEEEAERGENEERQPAYDDVMYWLLTHLPNIQEDDAISYFHHLLEDGFDNIDILKEIIDDDLYFMKKGHRRALMRSLSSADVSPKEDTADDVAADNEIIVDLIGKVRKNDLENITLDEDYAIGQTRSEENEGSWISEQDQLYEKSIAAGLAEMEESPVTSQRSSAHADEEVASEDDEYEDITRSSFVDKSSPSSAILSSSAGLRSGRRAILPYIEKEPNEEVFDITRDAFSDRPSLSAAKDSREPLTTGQRTRSKKGYNSSGSSPDGMAPSVNTPSSSPSPSYNAAVELVPRAELHQFYIKEGLSNGQAQTLKSYFTTWTNGAKSHELKFTCIFTCPVTGEHFACGDWRTAGSGTDKMIEVPSCQTYWYSEFCFTSYDCESFLIFMY